MNYPSTSKPVAFENDQGITLKGILEVPIVEPKVYAVYAHCFTCTKNSVAAVRVSKSLAQQGVAVLRFDFTGLGQSGGEFSDSNFTTNVNDVIAAHDFLAREYDKPTLLIGHSLGGSAVLASLQKLDGIEAVVTIGAPSDPEHVTHNFTDSLSKIVEEGEACVKLGPQTLKLKKQFLDDLANYRCLDYLAKSRVALLVCHSPADTTVSIEHARHIFEAAKHPKSFLSLVEANHLLTKKEDASYVARMIANWASYRIPKLSEDEVAEDDQTVTVEETHQGKFQQLLTANGRHMIADEPESIGGGNTGPNPYNYLLMGLGACTSMTLRMYASHKQLPLEHITVTLEHDKCHADDCGNPDSKGKKLDRITKRIQVTGELSEEQVHRLHEIADMCPVHKTLTSEIIINSNIEKFT